VLVLDARAEARAYHKGKNNDGSKTTAKSKNNSQKQEQRAKARTATGSKTTAKGKNNEQGQEQRLKCNRDESMFHQVHKMTARSRLQFHGELVGGFVGGGFGLGGEVED
jgi:hypothetical protein